MILVGTIFPSFLFFKGLRLWPRFCGDVGKFLNRFVAAHPHTLEGAHVLCFIAHMILSPQVHILHGVCVGVV